MAVPFDEEHDSPTKSFSDGKYTIVRHGKTLWANKAAFIAELMPPSLTFATAAGQFFGAPFPGDTLFRVSSFVAKPFGAQTGFDAFGVPTYALADWTINYQVPLFPNNVDTEEDPVGFLTHEWAGGGEFLTLSNLAVSWDNPSTGAQNHARDAHAGIFVPTVEHTITWERVEKPNFVGIRQLIGKVNNAPVQLRTGIALKETLLFLAPRLSQQVMTDGAKAWKVTFKFSERRVPAEDKSKTQSAIGGWNHFWRDPEKKSGLSAGFYRLYKTYSAASVTGSPYVYELADFAQAFQAGTGPTQVENES